MPHDLSRYSISLHHPDRNGGVPHPLFTLIASHSRNTEFNNALFALKELRRLKLINGTERGMDAIDKKLGPSAIGRLDGLESAIASNLVFIVQDGRITKDREARLTKKALKRFNKWHPEVILSPRRPDNDRRGGGSPRKRKPKKGTKGVAKTKKTTRGAAFTEAAFEQLNAQKPCSYENEFRYPDTNRCRRLKPCKQRRMKRDPYTERCVRDPTVPSLRAKPKTNRVGKHQNKTGRAKGVKVCQPGKEIHPIHGRCVPVCKPNHERLASTGKCVKACKGNEYRHWKTQKCRKVSTPRASAKTNRICKPGKEIHPIYGRCVPVCKPNKERLAHNGKCVVACKPNQQRHPVTHKCRNVI